VFQDKQPDAAVLGNSTYVDVNGVTTAAVDQVMDTRFATKIPCGGNMNFRWNNSQSEFYCNGANQVGDVIMGIAGNVPNCGLNGTVIAKSPIDSSRGLCLSLSSQLTTQGNGTFATHTPNPPTGYGRTTCTGGNPIFFAGGNTYCPEDIFYGGIPLCARGMTTGYYKPAANSPSVIGCFLMRTNGLPGGHADIDAIKVPKSCPSNYILKIKETYHDATDGPVNLSNVADCVPISDALASLFPAATCPSQTSAMNLTTGQWQGGYGAFTWNATQKKFTCTMIGHYMQTLDIDP
jgi:hypothetical protein